MSGEPDTMTVHVEGGTETREVDYYEAPSVRTVGGQRFTGKAVAIPKLREGERLEHLLDGSVYVWKPHTRDL